MAISCIHIQPVKSNSEEHNLRQKDLDYTRKTDTPENTNIVYSEIRPTLQKLQKICKEKTGRAMQKKATPIREGVVVLDKKTSVEQLKNMSSEIEKRFGIKTLQLHLHEDEGHKDIHSEKWKKNRHAHIVFQWFDENTGKSIKLNKKDMAEFQDLVANSLNMKRGKKSTKKHLAAVEYKIQEKEKDLKQLSIEKTAKEALKGTVNAVFRVDTKKELKKQIEGLKASNKSLVEDNTRLSQELIKSEDRNKRLIKKDLYDDLNKSYNDNKELVKLLNEKINNIEKVALRLIKFPLDKNYFKIVENFSKTYFRKENLDYAKKNITSEFKNKDEKQSKSRRIR